MQETKLTGHAFHVINVTFHLLKHRLQTRLLQVLPKCQVHVSNVGSCVNFQRKSRRMNSSQGARAVSESFVTTSQLCRGITRGRRGSQGVVDTTTVNHQSSKNLVLLPIASFANPAVQTELLSSTSVCRQLHHRRLLLLEFLLQTTILPLVSDHSNAKISETCLILCLATARSLQ